MVNSKKNNKDTDPDLHGKNKIYCYLKVKEDYDEEIYAMNYQKSAKLLLPPMNQKKNKTVTLMKQNSFATNYTKGTVNITEIDFFDPLK